MTFSEKLKQLRSQKGVSQTQLAADIHISRSAVAKWENGLGMPNDASLQLLAAYFGVSVEDLDVQSEEAKDHEMPDISAGKPIVKTKRAWLAALIIVLCVMGVLVLALAVIAIIVIGICSVIVVSPVQLFPAYPG